MSVATLPLTVHSANVRRRKLKSRVMTGLLFGCLVAALAPLVMILGVVIDKGAPSFTLSFLTKTSISLPAAGPGIITGSMLAIARALGETAPLILTAFGALQVVTHLQGQPQAALTLLIFTGARSPFEAAKAKAWAGALELMLLVLVITI